MSGQQSPGAQEVAARRARTKDARGALIRAALLCLVAQMAEESADAAADAEYAEERLAFAARDLAAATDALPAVSRPVGWSA